MPKSPGFVSPRRRKIARDLSSQEIEIVNAGADEVLTGDLAQSEAVEPSPPAEKKKPTVRRKKEPTKIFGVPLTEREHDLLTAVSQEEMQSMRSAARKFLVKALEQYAQENGIDH